MVFSSLFFLYAFLPLSLLVYVLCPGMKAKNINLDRKVLADLAVNNPEAFKAIVTAVKEK